MTEKKQSFMTRKERDRALLRKNAKKSHHAIEGKRGDLPVKPFSYQQKSRASLRCEQGESSLPHLRTAGKPFAIGGKTLSVHLRRKKGKSRIPTSERKKVADAEGNQALRKDVSGELAHHWPAKQEKGEPSLRREGEVESCAETDAPLTKRPRPPPEK